MFKGIFGSKSSPIEPIIPKENYSIFKLDVDGLAFATINTGYDNYQNKRFYPWCASILIDIVDKNDNGHPTNKEAEILNELEEKISNFLSQTQVVHKIGRVTRNGERDIFFYLDEPNFDETKTKDFFDSINAIRNLNFEIEKDAKWDNVSAFLK